MARPAAVIAVVAVVVASAAAAVARVPCPVEFALGADGRRRPVRLAVIGVSKRSNVDVRDAIRRTWCATARALNAETRGAATVKVRWTVARPPGAVAADDDAAEQDVRTVNHVDSPSASSRGFLLAFLDAPAFAPDATHVLAVDDDAYPFLDRLVGELAAKRAATQDIGDRAPPRPVALEATFVWGYYMVHGDFGPWPFPVGFGRVFSADVVRAVAAAHAVAPLDFGDDSCVDGGQASCVKGVAVYGDNFVGLLLAPIAHQRVHDRRFHALVGGTDDDRGDHVPAYPASPASLVVDRHDLKKHIGAAAFLDAVHLAATTADYDAVNALIGCGASRVACHYGPGPRDPAEAASFDYAMTIGDTQWVMRVNSCAWAYGLDEAWCARDLTSPNEAIGDRLYGADCAALLADVRALARVVLPSTCAPRSGAPAACGDARARCYYDGERPTNFAYEILFPEPGPIVLIDSCPRGVDYGYVCDGLNGAARETCVARLPDLEAAGRAILAHACLPDACFDDGVECLVDADGGASGVVGVQVAFAVRGVAYEVEVSDCAAAAELDAAWCASLADGDGALPPLSGDACAGLVAEIGRIAAATMPATCVR